VGPEHNKFLWSPNSQQVRKNRKRIRKRNNKRKRKRKRECKKRSNNNFRFLLEKGSAIIFTSSASAAAACFVPIPFADFASLIVIHTSMLASLCYVWGLSQSQVTNISISSSQVLLPLMSLTGNMGINFLK